ncbi:MAG: polyphosphate:AMP phosphotransferase [Methanomicrobiales archaeon]|nr:polyphosphate:AMP phosphotransferase [Methanomicrobiales archaeon]
MLESFDLSVRIRSESYDAVIDDLRAKLSELQRKVLKQERGVLIVIEGRRGSGISSLSNKLYQALDPRGTRVVATGEPSDIEQAHTFLWRFWNKLPPSGAISVFDRSWYSRAIVEKYHEKKKDSVPHELLSSFEHFETQLVTDGYLIIKFFLEISENEQEKRLDKKKCDIFSPLGKNGTKEKGKQSRFKYHEITALVEKMFLRTNTASSPWHIIAADQLKYAEVEMFQTIISSLESWLEKQKIPEKEYLEHKKEEEAQTILLESTALTSLTSIDPYVPMDKSTYNNELKEWQKKLEDLQVEVYTRGIRIFVVFEGWDAAGKGGCILRLTSPLNPRAYVVEPIGAPNNVESRYHYLWRFYTRFPEMGHITVFDRSWYGRVLVERVEGFCREDEWMRAYHEINQMESMLHDHNDLMVKFWLHIDQDEQLRRFTARQEDPQKQWKITDEDWRNREKWGQYLKAVDDMIHKTSTPHAPWTIVPANNKYYARVFTIQVLCGAIESQLQSSKGKGKGK